MIAARLPVLTEDDFRMDWTRARYTAQINVKRDRALIVHQLEDAPELDRLLEDSSAGWVTELRCPRTLLSRLERSRKPEQTINLRADDLVGDVYLIPGLVAVCDLELDTAGLNDFVWPENGTIRVPEGWWLARSDPRTTTPLTASLIRFRRDPDGRLAPGQMSVEEDSDGGKPYFRVVLAQDLYDGRREDRDVQIAGLIGASGMLPRSTMRTGGENELSIVASQLRIRFEEADIADWTQDDYDPARAATLLEAFYEPLGEEEAD
jgi:hypothetical protein